MKKSTAWIGLWLLLLVAPPVTGQQPYRVHSHNDYLQNVPFWYAYSGGSSSIEVDLYLQNDTLFATHSVEEIRSDKTFTSTYLDQLDFLAKEGRLSPVQLLIDVKSAAYETLDRIVATLENYPLLINDDKVSFVISGNRPQTKDYSTYPAFIYFDHQSFSDLDELDLTKVAMISQPFTAYSRWNGYGRMTATDLARVESALEKGRRMGKPFRFWATPDTKTAWACFANLGVDYINTDRPATASAFLDRLADNTYTAPERSTTYIPKNALDPIKKPRNIILMIGDGNGLAQISAARIANHGELSLTAIKHVGLVNTSSADDQVTDSAAGATAMATGVKTNNRAIGVDSGGQSVQSLIEILSEKGYNTGIITTDAIDGATTAAFYAHTGERDDSDQIIRDLVRSRLSFFIAGGGAREPAIRETFVSTTLDDFNNLEHPTAIYNGANKMPTMEEGRGDFLPLSVRKALTILGEQEAPFFLLVEGAQIDNGGHANSISTVITELLDFDRAVGQSLAFSDTDRETLVIATADHETGGLGIAGGNNRGEVRADFLSVDHSGTLVPLFAYGPRADEFTGVFDNTEIFHRIMAVLGVE